MQTVSIVTRRNSYLHRVRADQVDAVGAKRIDTPSQNFPGALRCIDRVTQQANLLRLDSTSQSFREVFMIGMQCDCTEILQAMLPIGRNDINEKAARNAGRC